MLGIFANCDKSGWTLFWKTWKLGKSQGIFGDLEKSRNLEKSGKVKEKSGKFVTEKSGHPEYKRMKLRK